MTQANEYDLARKNIYNESVEQMVLSGMMRGGSVIYEIINYNITDKHFEIPKHKIIFNQLMTMHLEDSHIDIVTVVEKLSNNSNLTVVGGMNYITHIATLTYSSIETSCRLLKEYYIRRMLNGMSKKILSDIVNGCDAIDEVIYAMRECEGIYSELSIAESLSNFDIAQSSFDRYLAIKEGKEQTLQLGFKEIDKYTYPTAGDLVLIPARPSMGKTALAVTLANNFSVKRHIPGAFITLETTAQRIFVRMFANYCSVDSKNYMRGTFTEKEIIKFNEFSEVFCKSPITIRQPVGINTAGLKILLQELKKTRGIQYAIIDYAQLLKPTGKYSTDERGYAEISMMLKEIGISLGLVMFVTVQLNRNVEARTSKLPTLADLRNTGQFEQDADIVVFIHRPEYYDEKTYKDGESTENKATLIIGKNKESELCYERLWYRKEFVRFESKILSETYNYYDTDEDVEPF